jgi:mRNA interferase RelE/StbE
LISYRIFETEQFQKDLKQITRSGQSKIGQKLREYVYPQLREHPHYGANIKKLKDYGANIKKLKDFSPETWRYRIGAWRFFYEIDEEQKIIYMLAASHRSRAYRH